MMNNKFPNLISQLPKDAKATIDDIKNTYHNTNKRPLQKNEMQ